MLGKLQGKCLQDTRLQNLGNCVIRCCHKSAPVSLQEFCWKMLIGKGFNESKEKQMLQC